MTSDPDSRPGGEPGPPHTRSPNLIPVEVLRGFVEEQARRHTYRTLAERWDIGHETLRKFATGRTVQPHPRQRELIGAEFLEMHPAGYVLDDAFEPRPRPLPPLKRLLPAERAEALGTLDRIFTLAERHPDELPEQAAAVHAWMRRVLEAEFDAETRYPPGKRPRGPSGARER